MRKFNFIIREKLVNDWSDDSFFLKLVTENF